MKNVYVSKSSIAGRGLFAAKKIPKGEFIIFLKGTLMHRIYRTRNDYRKEEENWVPVALHRWIDPNLPIKYLNHSCHPDAGFKTPRRLYAMRDIEPGEEITVDYSTIEYVDFWSMRCTCGASNCRKVIRSIQFLSPKTFKQYLPYISRFLQKIYLQYKSTHRHHGR